MHNQISWTQTAYKRILRPIVRLALSLGLKHVEMECVLRDLLIEEARRLWQRKGEKKPNISQLAITTGLSRKDVTTRVRTATGPLPAPLVSPASQVFTAWLQAALESPQRKRLPVKAEGHEISFESLAKEATRGNVHHRAVLEDLVRLGMVVELEGQVELTVDGFVPLGDLESMLAFLGANVSDHLEAAVGNVLGSGPRLLERAVYADGLTPQQSERIHKLARIRWDALHGEFVRELNQAVEKSGSAGTQRIRIGTYVFYEDSESQAQKSSTKVAPK